MRILIITVAGTASRFSQSVGSPCLKCIYSTAGIENSLLYRMLHQTVDFDKYVIVGGYMYDSLNETINKYFCDYKDRITLINNDKFVEYGSGYSLYKGIRAIIDTNFNEVVFAEGDLFLDTATFRKICDSKKSVVTCNNENILADKAVAFYFDLNNRIHYIFDTGHNYLEINEPFLSIFNSGQVWKFADAEHMKYVYSKMNETDWQGTNLVFIEKYFSLLGPQEFEVLKFKQWINCNTIQDYERIKIYTEKSYENNK